MKVILPSYEILTTLDKEIIFPFMERIARTCYKSEDLASEGSAERILKNLIKNGHEAMIEFFDITVKFTCNRGFSHEMVRHRLCSFSQESTRYCNYSSDKFGNEITVIQPAWIGKGNETAEILWLDAMKSAEDFYFKALEQGLKAQDARGMLPIDLKTELNVKANIREWRAIFKLRTTEAAHPSMRELMIPLLTEFKSKLPVLFDDIVF